MQNQTIIRLAVIAGLLFALVWWLLPSESEQTDIALDNGTNGQNLVSAIQPITDADAITNPQQLPEKQTQAIQFTPESKDLKDFEEANTALQTGDIAKAKELLAALIQRQPGLLEPYINLASAQAMSGELELARQTLMQGLNANENYGALFDNLREVHAALAADAYQMALAEDPLDGNTPTNKPLQLPIVTALNANVAPGDEKALAGARSRIEELQASLAKEQQALTAKQKELAAANSIVQTQETTVQSLREELKVAASTAQLNDDATTTATGKAEALQTRLTAAQQQISQLLESHEAEIAALKLEAQQQQNTLAEQQLLANQEKQAQTQRIAELEQQLSNQVALAAVSTPEPSTTVVSPPPSNSQTESPNLNSATPQASAAATAPGRSSSVETSPTALGEENAIARVKSWAVAWSEQDVPAYISHYREGYVPPGSAISHAEWREQRQVRLTNKAFIEISLSDFTTQLEGDVLQVSFLQRYRSNTMDDTIRKQLSLTTNDSDWSNAKIVAERVLR